MILNLDFLKPAKLFWQNIKTFLKISGWVLLTVALLGAILGISIPFIIKSTSYIAPVCIIVSFCIALILLCLFFQGFWVEIQHNLILENDNFMPTVKGRIKEYIVKGFKDYVVLLPFALLIGVICLSAILMGYAELHHIFALVAVCSIILLVYYPFGMAYPHTFSLRETFKKHNFTIFNYAIPEFAYTMSVSYFVSLVANVVALLAVLIAGVVFGVLFVLLLLAKVEILAFVILGIFGLCASFLGFVLMMFSIFYFSSLCAQSYNYGKYFLHMGEKPKKERIEYLTAILLFVLYCALQCGAQYQNATYNDNNYEKIKYQIEMLQGKNQEPQRYNHHKMNRGYEYHKHHKHHKHHHGEGFSRKYPNQKF